MRGCNVLTMTNRNKQYLFILILVGLFLLVSWLFTARLNNSEPFVEPTPKTQQEEKMGIIPTRIEIPAIGVDTKVESVGFDTTGKRMANPMDTRNTAWFSMGYRPGEKGTAVISGHLDQVSGAPAVFYNLKKLKPGDLIFVYDADERIRYEVTEVKTYPWNKVPLEKIHATRIAGLNLITCEGSFVGGNYTHRTVVYSKQL
jgi:sortase A